MVVNSLHLLSSRGLPITTSPSSRMRLKTCFYCCSLRTGTMAIGTVSFLWALLSVLCAGSFVEELDELDDDLEPLQQFFVKVASVGTLIYILAIAAISALMIYGARNGKFEYVFPWLALATAHFMWAVSVFIGGIILLPTINGVATFFAIVTVFSGLSGLIFYVWLIVYSFYQELVTEYYTASTFMEKDPGPDPLKKVWYSV